MRPEAEPPPKPGDVFVIPETSHLAVEWAILDRDDASQWLYAVPADTRGLAGGHDVRVTEVSSGGPLSLHCGLGLWLPPEVFAADLRSGVLERSELCRARRAWESAERVADRPIDTDHEHLEREPAQTRALLRQRFATSGAAVASARPQRRSATRSRHGSGRSFALAAALLLPLTLVTSGALVWQLRAEKTRLEAENQELRRQPPQPAINLLTVSLFRVRGGQKIAVPPEAQALVLLIHDLYPEPGATYRLEVRAEEPPRTIWSRDGLRLLEASEQLTVSLSTRDLPNGQYRILVSALRHEGADRIGDYRIEIEHQGNEHPPKSHPAPASRRRF